MEGCFALQKINVLLISRFIYTLLFLTILGKDALTSSQGRSPLLNTKICPLQFIENPQDNIVLDQVFHLQKDTDQDTSDLKEGSDKTFYFATIKSFMACHTSFSNLRKQDGNPRYFALLLENTFDTIPSYYKT